MKARHLSLLSAFVFVFHNAFAADPNPSPRLIVELRDGSRIVGQSLESKIKFHSELFGDFKLDVDDVRSVDCSSTNSATLNTVAGDTLAVSFVDRELDLKTSFGEVEFPVDSIRKFSVSGKAFEARIPGLVALWSGANEGRDSVGGNDGIWTNISFADGIVGQAFSLDGTSSCAQIPSSSSLDVGEGEGMTLSVWIKPSNVFGFHPIMEWEKTSALIGVQLWIGQYPSSQGVLCACFMDPNGNNYVQVPSPPMALVPGQWQHAAVTYDKASGLISLYLNGQLINQRNWGSFVPLTTGPIWISRRPNDHPGDWTYHAFFGGLMDQIAIYNRALSADEIKSICMQDNGGAMPLNPYMSPMGDYPQAMPRGLPMRTYPGNTIPILNP